MVKRSASVVALKAKKTKRATKKRATKKRSKVVKRAQSVKKAQPVKKVATKPRSKTAARAQKSKKKAIKKRGTKRDVIAGRALKTSGGLTKKDFRQTKHGKWVSKKKSKGAKGNKWIIAVGKARKELGITGFVQMKKGTKFYKRAKAIYNGAKPKSAARSAAGKKNIWVQAVAAARKELGVKGFGDMKKGSKLHTRAKEIHAASKAGGAGAAAAAPKAGGAAAEEGGCIIC